MRVTVNIPADENTWDGYCSLDVFKDEFGSPKFHRNSENEEQEIIGLNENSNGCWQPELLENERFNGFTVIVSVAESPPFMVKTMV